MPCTKTFKYVGNLNSLSFWEVIDDGSRNAISKSFRGTSTDLAAYLQAVHSFRHRAYHSAGSHGLNLTLISDREHKKQKSRDF
tara:strand:+ start:224 stop:472 length:249 start_codon:yes stop_codon:yes gene_type:complete